MVMDRTLHSNSSDGDGKNPPRTTAFKVEFVVVVLHVIVLYKLKFFWKYQLHIEIEGPWKTPRRKAKSQ